MPRISETYLILGCNFLLISFICFALWHFYILWITLFKCLICLVSSKQRFICMCFNLLLLHTVNRCNFTMVIIVLHVAHLEFLMVEPYFVFLTTLSDPAVKLPLWSINPRRSHSALLNSHPKDSLTTSESHSVHNVRHDSATGEIIFPMLIWQLQ